MGKLYLKRNFSQTPVSLLNNKEISMKAKGMYGFIQSKPDGWDFSAKRIAAQIKEGVSFTDSCLQELESSGYLERIKSKNDKGHWDIDYILHEIPVVKNPVVENPRLENPRLENPSTENPSTENHINNSKIDYSKKDNSNIYNSNSKQQKFDFRTELIKKGFDEILVDDWIAVRKKKKASNTKTALNLFLKQVEKSGRDKNEILELTVGNSWQSFNVKYLDNSTNNNFDDNLDNNIIDWEKYLEVFNKSFKTSYKTINQETKKGYASIIKLGYTKSDLMNIINLASKNTFDSNYITPSYLSKVDNFERLHNAYKDKKDPMKPMKGLSYKEAMS